MNREICNKSINRQIDSEFFSTLCNLRICKGKKKTMAMFAHRTLEGSVNTNRNPRVIDSTF